MRALVLLCLLAACAGAPKDPAPAATEPRIDELEGFSDRACACADRACTDRLEQEMADWFRTASPDWYRAQSGDRPSDALQRLFKCIGTRGTIPYSLGVVKVGVFASIRTDICACADPTCARRAVAAWADAVTRLNHLSTTDVDQRDLDERIVPEATACFERGNAMIGEEVVLELKSLRKAACACQDAACVSANRADLEDWAARHEQTGVDKRTEEQVLEITRELALCHAAASQEASRQAVIELTAIRDAACGCTLPRCADESQAAFEAFLEAYADVRGTPEDAKRIGEVAAELAACLDTSRGE